MSYSSISRTALNYFGTEKIIHTLLYELEVRPTYDKFCMDAIGRFDSCSKKNGLCRTLKKLPALSLPFVNMLCSTDSKCWFFGHEDGTKSIECREGAQRGCAMGMLLCMCYGHPSLCARFASHPRRRRISSLLRRRR